MIEGQGCHLALVVAVLGRSAGRIVAKMGKRGGGLTNEPPESQTLCNPSATDNNAAEFYR